MAKRTAPPRLPAAPPATAADGAEAVRQFMLKLFARHDGEAVDRRMIAETLFRAAFDAVDRLPNDEKQAIARRVHAGSYDRVAGNEPSSKSGPEGNNSSGLNIDYLKSLRPTLPQ